MPMLNSYSHLFYLGCLFFLVLSCELSENNKFEETYTYSFQKDKQIVVDTTARQITDDSTATTISISLQPGNDLVFHYEKRVTPPPEVMDGGSITTVYFQVPPNTEQFMYEGKELTNANVYFMQSCFCPIIGALKVESGTLEGQKLSDNLWSISASLQPEGPNATYDVQFEGAFILNTSQE